MFTWMNFDPSFLKSVLLSSEEFKEKYDQIKEEDDIIGLVTKMNIICPLPDKYFIIKYRKIIENDLLKNYPDEIKKICKILNIGGRSFNEKQSAMTQKSISTSLVNAYISAIYTISGLDVQINEYSRFKYTVSLNMSQTEIEEVPLYDFQEKAVESLKTHLLDKDNAAGLLVMPTGSGKSRTSTYFLIKEMVSRGYQILWISHRHMLIDQAADCFYKYAGLSKINNPKIQNYNINCVSSEHLSIKQVPTNKNEIIIASINSLWRNKEHLKRILGKKVIVVIDEAHHSFAPTYQDTISFVRKCRKNMKLLGLTATPIRSNEQDSQKLLKLFNNNIIFNIGMSDLIAKGVLADPRCVRLETGENFEPNISEEEAKLIKKYKELPESVVNKIASSHKRNQFILKEYLENREKYGKTLIFAMNIIHCRLLCEKLKENNVKCECVYSGKEDNIKIIDDFKNGNKYDVLVNVNILTEGSDVPNIQTIFLTRPTQSEGLLMQMIGRGMRGKKAHGTEYVNIVDFHDQWNTFNKWLNPEWIVCDELSEEENDIPELREYKKAIYTDYDWDSCKELYNSMKNQAVTYGKLLILPAAWYTLIDEEGELHRMLVFEDQLKGFLELQKNKSTWINDLNITPNDIIQKYFSYFCTKPLYRDIKLLIDNIRNCEFPPTLKILEDRKRIDPFYVAKEATDLGKDIFSYADKIFNSYDVAKDLYGNVENYQMEVCKAKVYEGKNVIIGAKVEELPVELIPFDRTPFYNLDELVREVIDEQFGGEYNGIGNVSWTDKPYKTFYGRFYPYNGYVDINSVLNSKDVPKEVVKFVIYHEFLHRDNHSHDKAFKEKEHLYPNFEDHEAFLFGRMNEFDIKDF